MQGVREVPSESPMSPGGAAAIACGCCVSPSGDVVVLPPPLVHARGKTMSIARLDDGVLRRDHFGASS